MTRSDLSRRSVEAGPAFHQKDAPRIRDKVEAAILSLETNPRPAQCLKMTDYPHGWRIDLGDYRMVYEIYDERLYIWVVEAGPRGGMYKNR